MAGPTGLEPATSGVTGQRSNQLNYDPDLTDTLRLLTGSCTRAIPAVFGSGMVGGTGLEPVTAGV